MTSSLCTTKVKPNFFQKYNLNKQFWIISIILFNLGFLIGLILGLIKLFIQKSC